MFSFGTSPYTVTIDDSIIDISQRISITKTILLNIGGISQLTNINTNNYTNVSSINYIPVDDTSLGVLLFKKEINYTKKENGYTNYWDLVQIPTNFNIPSTIGYHCNILTGNVVTVLLVESFTPVRENPIVRQFDIDSTYVIRVLFGKLGGDNSIVDIEFITKSKSDQLLSDYIIKNNLNTLYKLDNILDIRNIDCISDATNTKFDYTFNSSISNIVIPYKVSKITEDLLIKELLPDFITYFKSLELDIEQNTITIEEQTQRYDQLRKVKYSFLNNAQIINSGVRGTIDGMQLILDIYINNLSNYYYANIEANTSSKNFVYRLTTSLPRHIWTSVIRPIVHPVSWFDDFIYVNISDSSSNVNLPVDNTIHSNKIYQASTQIDSLPFSFLDFNNKFKGYSTRYNSFNLSSFGNLNTPYEYSFTDSTYRVQLYTSDMFKINDTLRVECELITINDSILNKTYNVVFIDGILSLIEISYTYNPTTKSLFSDYVGIDPFEIAVSNGEFSVNTGIIRNGESANNNFVDLSDNKLYALQTDGEFLYKESINPTYRYNKTYTINVTNSKLYLMDVPYISNINDPEYNAYLDFFSDNTNITPFRVTVTNGIASAETIIRTTELDNNYFIDTNGYTPYILQFENDHLYTNTLPLPVIEPPIIIPIDTIDTRDINDNLGVTYRLAVVDGVLLLNSVIYNSSATQYMNIFSENGASFRITIVDNALRVELITKTIEVCNNIIKDSNNNPYRLVIDPIWNTLYLLSL